MAKEIVSDTHSSPGKRRVDGGSESGAPARFASWVVPPWVRPALRRPDGQPVAAGLGWLLVAGGAGGLAWLLAGPMSATIGSSAFTYNTTLQSAEAPRGLWWVVVIGPMLGFNLVYWFSSPLTRVRQLEVLVAVFSAELLGLTGCVVWIAGAGYSPGAVFGLSAANADAVIGATCLLLLSLTAAAIMLWLVRYTTYEDQRDEYLYRGRTVVTVTKLSTRTHLCWVIGLLVVWALLFSVVVVANGRSSYPPTGQTNNLAWPAKYYDGSELDNTVGTYLPWFGLLWALWLSTLVEKVLYRGPWASQAARSSKRRTPSRRARLAVKFRHWPFAAGGLLASVGVTSSFGPGGVYWSELITGAAAALVCFAIGLLLFRWEWKVRDVNRVTFRLHLAGS